MDAFTDVNSCPFFELPAELHLGPWSLPLGSFLQCCLLPFSCVSRRPLLNYPNYGATQFCWAALSRGLPASVVASLTASYPVTRASYLKKKVSWLSQCKLSLTDTDHQSQPPLLMLGLALASCTSPSNGALASN